MKPVFEQIPDPESESFWCETIQGPGFGCTWHFHPEYELTLVLRSQGHRIVGDHSGTQRCLEWRAPIRELRVFE